MLYPMNRIVEIITIGMYAIINITLLYLSGYLLVNKNGATIIRMTLRGVGREIRAL